MSDDLEQRIHETIANPKNLGEMQDADSVGTVGSPDCGDMLRMWVKFKEEDGRLLINAVIWVERSGQKAIVIGNGGEQLKEVGRSARLEMVELFKRPVHLELWVKVKENWSDNETALRQLGYET